MMNKVLTSTLVALSLATAMVPATSYARDGRNGALAAGAAVGVVGGALLGSQLNNNRHRDVYDEAPPPRYVERDCYFQRQRVWDGDEYVIQRVRVCNR